MREVFVAHAALEKCMKFAKAYSASLKKGGSRYASSYAVDRRLNQQGNCELEYAGRVAEYALCLELGLDPATALDWKTTRRDAGYDLKLADGRTVDVKASDHPGASRLIWPVTKAKYLFGAADVFVMARVLKSKREPLGQIVEFPGCIPKARFIANAKKAYMMRGLVDGTQFMEQKDLDDIATLKQN